MDEMKPGVPDIIDPLAAEMERQGAGAKMIARYRELWQRLEPHSRVLPCPMCFSLGYVGKLYALLVDQYRNESVRCETCGVQILVKRGD